MAAKTEHSWNAKFLDDYAMFLAEDPKKNPQVIARNIFNNPVFGDDKIRLEERVKAHATLLAGPDFENKPFALAFLEALKNCE